MRLWCNAALHSLMTSSLGLRTPIDEPARAPTEQEFSRSSRSLHVVLTNREHNSPALHFAGGSVRGNTVSCTSFVRLLCCVNKNFVDARGDILDLPRNICQGKFIFLVLWKNLAVCRTFSRPQTKSLSMFALNPAFTVGKSAAQINILLYIIIRAVLMGRQMPHLPRACTSEFFLIELYRVTEVRHRSVDRSILLNRGA